MNKGYILVIRHTMSYMQGYETKGDININKINKIVDNMN